MRKNDRQYIKATVCDIAVRRGRPMRPEEIKTKRHIRRYITMEMSAKIIESYWAHVIAGAPRFPGDPIPKGIMGEMVKTQCREIEERWRASNVKPRAR